MKKAVFSLCSRLWVEIASLRTKATVVKMQRNATAFHARQWKGGIA